MKMLKGLSCVLSAFLLAACGSADQQGLEPQSERYTVTVRVNAQGGQVVGGGVNCHFPDRCKTTLSAGQAVTFYSTVPAFYGCDAGSSTYICRVRVERNRTISLNPRSGGGDPIGPIP